MKRLMIIAVVVGLLVVGVAVTAWAQGATPPAQNAPAADGACPCGLTPGSETPGAMMGRGGMMGGGMMGGGRPEWAGMDEAVETLLGMTTEQLQAERLAGKSLIEIATAKNVSEQALTDAIMAEHKADLAKLVADGKLTQAQADLMLANMGTMVQQMITRTVSGPAWSQGQGGQGQQTPPTGGMRGRGGMGGRGGGMMTPRSNGTTG